MRSRYVYIPDLNTHLLEDADFLSIGFNGPRRRTLGTGGGHFPELNLKYPGQNSGQSRASTQLDFAAGDPSAADTLYVLLYFRSGSGELCSVPRNDPQRTGVTFTPETLAQHLRDQRLTFTIRDLRILASWSGTDFRDVGGPEPFALRLKQQMVLLGYYQIMVTGYKGEFRDYEYLQRQHRNARLHPNAGYTAGMHKGVYTLSGLELRASAEKVQF